jgi:mono/diheme cytochrome c family protein
VVAWLGHASGPLSHGVWILWQTTSHSIRNVGGKKGPDLSGVGRRMKEAQMRRQIVQGSKVMPAFGDILQETELSDLLSYLRSCRDKERK